MSKYIQKTDFGIGQDVWFIHNNKVTKERVETIVIFSYKVDSKNIINMVSYKISVDGESYYIDEEKLFGTSDDLRSYLNVTNGVRPEYDKCYVVECGYSINDNVYFMLEDEIKSCKISKIKTSISVINNNYDEPYFGVEYLFDIDGEGISVMGEDVFGGRSSLVKHLFENI